MYEELLSIYPKVIKVVQSCKTMPQYFSAITYVQLYLSKCPMAIRDKILPDLSRICNRQKFLISLVGFGQ